MSKKKKYGNFVSISSLTGEYTAKKIKNFCSSSLWTCLYHMVILRSQNKITDFYDFSPGQSLISQYYKSAIIISSGTFIMPQLAKNFHEIFNFQF